MSIHSVTLEHGGLPKVPMSIWRVQPMSVITSFSGQFRLTFVHISGCFSQKGPTMFFSRQIASPPMLSPNQLGGFIMLPGGRASTSTTHPRSALPPQSSPKTKKETTPNKRKPYPQGPFRIHRKNGTAHRKTDAVFRPPHAASACATRLMAREAA